LCRRHIRGLVTRVLRERGRWVCWLSILYDLKLGWVPGPLLASILGELVLRGLVIQQRPRGEVPVYLLTELTYATLPVRAKAGEP
jgi:hypothetical protein